MNTARCFNRAARFARLVALARYWFRHMQYDKFQ